MDAGNAGEQPCQGIATWKLMRSIREGVVSRDYALIECLDLLSGLGERTCSSLGVLFDIEL